MKINIKNPFARNCIGKLIEAEHAPDDRMMQITAAVDITAAPVGDDGKPDPGKARPFSMVAYTGGTLKLQGWFHPVVVDLEGLQISTPMTILGNHLNDPDWVAGSADSIEVRDHQLLIAGEIFPKDTTPMTQKIARLSAAGMKWQASIGAEAIRMEFVQPGKKAGANGRTFDGPCYIARKAKLRETSFVVLGADGGTSANVAASQTPELIGAETMNPQFKQWLTANGFDPEIVASNESQSQFLEAAWKTETQPPAEPDGDSVSLDDLQAQIADMRREHQIARICGGEFADIQAQALKEGWTAELVEAKVETARQKQKLEAGFAMPQIHISGDGSDGPNPAAVMEASLCISGVLSEEEAGAYFDERTMNAAVGSDFQGFGLADLMFASIAAAGTAIRAGSVTDEVVRAAMTADRRQIEAGFSTLSFSGILSNVANKRLLKAYRAVPSVIDRIAALRDVPDFKQVTSYSLAADGSFQEVGPDGELKHIGLKDTGYTNQAKTEGAIIALTRKMMINDDLGAFLKIPALLGRQAALARERAGFKCLLDNIGDFFHADNSNYETGADTALSIGSLSTGTQTFLDQTDGNGDPILVSPAILLVPTGLKIYAEQLYKDVSVNETTTANKPKPASNPHAGKYRPISSPFLNNTTFHASASAKAWFLLADPNDLPTLEMVYLKGKRTPTIERGELDFNKLGVAFRGFFDFGANLCDFRAAVKMAGE